MKAQKLTAAQMNQALHLYKELTTPQEVLIYLDMEITIGTDNNYETDLQKLMNKGAKCYYSVWEKASKL